MDNNQLAFVVTMVAGIGWFIGYMIKHIYESR